MDVKGQTHVFGDGHGERVAVQLTDRRIEWPLGLDPSLALGEAYMNARLVMKEGGIYDLIHLVSGNAYARPLPAWLKASASWRYLTRFFRQFNTLAKSKRNASHHYDLPGAVYNLFLDVDRQYSCAYFADPNATLDEAQQAKKRHIAAKLRITDGLKILDIGSGWGGLALYLANAARVSVTGVTLSTEQLRISRQRALDASREGAVNFQLKDYRDVPGVFDRIVSVGMLEHVGAANLRGYFAKVYELLAPNGVALIHSIGRSEGPNATNPFIAKYIFPGGYIPSLSEALSAIERSGLFAADIEIWRLHYAETLRHWRERFTAARDKAAAIMGERFYRMWEFYLAGCESAFRNQGLMVFQAQLVKSVDALPITRDYMHANEQRLREIEATEPQTDLRKRIRMVNPAE